MKGTFCVLRENEIHYVLVEKDVVALLRGLRAVQGLNPLVAMLLP